MRVTFTRLARQELDDAVAHYEHEQPALGRRFKDEVRKAALRVASFPLAWSVERGEVRRCPLHRFPYKLLYAVEQRHVVVIAVAHQHRRPDYWVGRDRK